MELRDPERIDPVCAQIAEAWRSLPDWRFCQLMMNFVTFMKNLGKEPFVMEDDKFADAFKEYCEGVGSIVRKEAK